MTTSHRAQLEARSGAKGASYIPTGTQHARLVPGHTKLKYRRSNQYPEKLYETNREDGDTETKESLQIGSADEKVSDGDQEIEEDADSDNYQDSDDDQELLLQELNKIRQERMIAKLRKEQEDEDKGEVQPVSAVLPLEQTKSGWRSNTTFGKRKVSKESAKDDKRLQKASKGYLNNLAKSDYHQDFLRRFVK